MKYRLKMPQTGVAAVMLIGGIEQRRQHERRAHARMTLLKRLIVSEVHGIRREQPPGASRHQRGDIAIEVCLTPRQTRQGSLAAVRELRETPKREPARSQEL